MSKFSEFQKETMLNTLRTLLLMPQLLPISRETYCNKERITTSGTGGSGRLGRGYRGQRARLGRGYRGQRTARQRAQGTADGFPHLQLSVPVSS